MLLWIISLAGIPYKPDPLTLGNHLKHIQIFMCPRSRVCKISTLFTKPFCFYIFRLPRYATKFIEMCLMVTADHGPAVSGAHNTIVCARAGKDLISSLTSGLLTIVSMAVTCSPCMDTRVWSFCFHGRMSQRLSLLVLDHCTGISENFKGWQLLNQLWAYCQTFLPGDIDIQKQCTFSAVDLWSFFSSTGQKPSGLVDGRLLSFYACLCQLTFFSIVVSTEASTTYLQKFGLMHFGIVFSSFLKWCKKSSGWFLYAHL